MECDPSTRGGRASAQDTSTVMDITRPGDAVIGQPANNNWPGEEAPANAIDDSINTKYLHFDGATMPTGLIVTPGRTHEPVRGLSFTTANDDASRDPVAFELYGSNGTTSGPYTLIASGPIADFAGADEWPRFTRNATPIHFANSTVYAHYKLMFTAVRHPGGADSMQIAEVELLQLLPGGYPPQVDAGPDLAVPLPYRTLTLAGSVSDEEPDALAVEWRLRSAPAGVSQEDLMFTPDRHSAAVQVQFPNRAGTYTFELYAFDGYTSTTDTVQVAVTEPLCPAGDLNGDCRIDLADLWLLAESWLSPSLAQPGGPDLDGDQSVTLTDYGLLAESWQAHGPSIVISEFLTGNTARPPLAPGQIVDEDSDSSDWIELYNASKQPVALGGWHLSDDPDDPARWVLPAITLAPDEYRLIFASGKDRTDPAGELHANFSLAVSGGFLALVEPDGRTVAHQIEYPRQFADIAYGLAAPNGLTASETIELVAEGAAAWSTIPVDASLGSSWTGADFVPQPGAWKAGATGVGFDTITTGINYNPLIGLNVQAMLNQNASVYIRIPFTIDDLSELADLSLSLRYDDGFAAWINGVPAASVNAPTPLTWNARASQSRTNSQAIMPEAFALPQEALDALRIGTNVLAIQGLNHRATDADLLILPRLTVERHNTISRITQVRAFFPEPTPGQPNGSGVMALGPRIDRVTQNPALAPGQALTVTARVRPLATPVAAVHLRYRVNFAAETTVVMADDGVAPDSAAGDGIYSAALPAAAFAPGAMVRWAVTAVDTGGTGSREPLFLAPLRAPEYYGTVATDPAIQTQLPVFSLFVQNTAAAGSDLGTRASVHYDGQFYDNVFIRRRGGNTTSGYKIDFNNGYYFQLAGGLPPVDEINLNEQGADPTYVRPVISFDWYRAAGLPASVCQPLHVRRNGEFLDIRHLVEQPDSHLLERVGLDTRGALYKVYSDLSLLVGEQAPRKVTRRFEDTGDLQALIDGISPDNPDRDRYVMDFVDIPAVLNYLAVSTLVHENDHTHKNFFMYCDTEGTGQWFFIPWDKDLTFGLNNGIDGIIADQDWPDDPLRSPGHPFYGDRYNQKIDYQWNRLFDAIYQNPVTRDMYLRRLRTLMDQLLQPPDTAPADRRAERRIDEIAASYAAEKGATLLAETERIKTEYLAVRRQHFYVNHSVHNPGYPDNAGIPDAQPARVSLSFGAIEFNPASGNQDQEYIEIVNANDFAVDMTGWSLRDGVEHAFHPGTVIPAQRSLFVTPSVAAFRARTAGPAGGQGLLVQGQYQGHLSSWGETLALYDGAQQLIASSSYPGDPSEAQRYLRITELMYHPAPVQAGDPHGQEDYEFIELQNIGSTPLALAGVAFTQGIGYLFDDRAALPAGGWLILAKHPAAFAARYPVPAGTMVLGPYDGQLANGGESLTLDDATHSTILTFTYDDSWYDLTDGGGFSLTCVDPGHPDLNQWDRQAGWRASALAGGSPGGDDLALAPGSIVINELLAHSHGGGPDWIELRNTTGHAISLAGWFLTDDAGTPQTIVKYEFPAHAVIGAGGYLTIDQATGFGSAELPVERRFGLSEAGETVFLFSGANGEVTGFYQTSQKFGASATGVTLGRHEKETLSSGYDFVALAGATPGEANNAPLLAPLAITEIHYHPPQGSDYEFVELFNRSGQPLTLMQTVSTATSATEFRTETLPWRINGIGFTFPANTTLAPGERVIVAAQPASFNALFGASLPAAIRVLGPYTGKLDNSGEEISVQIPGDLEWGQARSYIDAERIDYQPASPWPTQADGLGASLQRLDPDAYGSDPANWTGAGPQPGH